MALAKSPRTGLRRKGHGQRTANGPAPSARERAPLPACIPARAEVERRVGLRRSAIYRRARDTRAINVSPKPVHDIGSATVWWLKSEIEEWQRTRIAARDAGEHGAGDPPGEEETGSAA